MNRRLAPERRARYLTAAVRDHFVDVHVELSAAAGHPYMEREHVVVLAGKDLVADLNDQFVTLIVKPPTRVVRNRRRLFQGGIRRDHFAGNQVAADREMLE